MKLKYALASVPSAKISTNWDETDYSTLFPSQLKLISIEAFCNPHSCIVQSLSSFYSRPCVHFPIHFPIPLSLPFQSLSLASTSLTTFILSLTFISLFPSISSLTSVLVGIQSWICQSSFIPNIRKLVIGYNDLNKFLISTQTWNI